MTDTEPQPDPTVAKPQTSGADHPVQRGRCTGRGGPRLRLIFLLVGTFLAGGFLFSHSHAFSGDEAAPVWTHHAAWTGDARQDGRPDHPPPMSPGEHLARSRETLERALTGIEATADQKSKVLAIFDEAARSLKDMPATVFTSGLQLATLLTAPTIDHDKLEALRSARVADLDAASKIVTKAVADAGDVLNPDQRVKLAMFIQHFHPAPPPR